MIDTIVNAMGKRSRMMARDHRQEAVSRAMTRYAGQARAQDYSAKRAAAGQDIGKPGKNFQKIANKYPGEKGRRIAGAVLRDIRAKHGG